MQREIFFSVGEPSGDLHAANLIRALARRDGSLRFVGFGGPEMAAAGCQLHYDLTSLAVMWIARVLINIHKFFALVVRADRYFRKSRPAAVVLVDYPGFNWWIAWRAKVQGIPVFYYTPPQIWAWASWRVRKMRRFVDHVLCSLPFEEPWFRERGCRATFVGHPFFDEVSRQRLDTAFLAEQRRQGGPLVTLLPGSRTQEVQQNFRWMLKAAIEIHRCMPQARFAVAAFKPHQAELCRRWIGRLDLPIEVHLRRTPELIELADCCLAVSGSVSLELLARTKPTVILYWISRTAYRVQSWFRHTRYITLVNLLADRELFPEYLTCEDRAHELAGHVVRWLRDADARRQTVQELAALREQVGHGGASQRAAEYIARILATSAPPTPLPHYPPSTAQRRAA